MSEEIQGEQGGGAEAEAKPQGETPPKTDEAKPEETTISKAQYDKRLRQLEDAKGRLAKYEQAEQEAADARAKAEGNVAEAQAERDKWKTRAEVLEKAERERLASLMDGLDEDGKALIAALGEDADVTVQLRQAEMLAAKKPTPKGDFGGNGVPKSESEAALIPATVKDMASYHAWLQGEQESLDPKRMEKILNPKTFAAIRAEAAKRFG